MALLLASCVFDDPHGVSGSSGSHLRLKLVMPQGSRAEKYEDALESENSVNNITVFFFNDSKGVDGDAETQLLKTVYVNSGFVVNDNEFNVDVLLPDEYNYTEGDRIAVVVNMGNLTRLSTLGDLQKYIPDFTWKYESAASPSGCRDFTMASAYDNDGLINIESVTPDGKTVYSASVTVERTAARIDLGYDQSQEKDEYIEYVSSSKEDGKVNGQVYLYGLSPINAMQQSSFAIKRISNGLSDDFSCFDSWHYTGVATNEDVSPVAYIMEPHTTLKRTDTEVPDAWYGPTSVAALSNSAWEDNLNIAALLEDEKIKFPIDGHRSVVVSYINENTQHYLEHDEKWLTGLLLRAVFVPATVYADASLTLDTDFKAGSTFWRYRPTDKSTDENNGVLYFSSEDAAMNYATDHPGDGAEITLYEKGRCFYHAWIRHLFPERVSGMPEIVVPMEYAIVRNHIYRAVFSFHGIGEPTPNIDNPQNADIAIYVRPWNVFLHDTIII